MAAFLQVAYLDAYGHGTTENQIEKRHKAEMETGSVVGIKRMATYIAAQDSLHNYGIGYLE